MENGFFYSKLHFFLARSIPPDGVYIMLRAPSFASSAVAWQLLGDFCFGNSHLSGRADVPRTRRTRSARVAAFISAATMLRQQRPPLTETRSSHARKKEKKGGLRTTRLPKNWCFAAGRIGARHLEPDLQNGTQNYRSQIFTGRFRRDRCQSKRKRKAQIVTVGFFESIVIGLFHKLFVRFQRSGSRCLAPIFFICILKTPYYICTPYTKYKKPIISAGIGLAKPHRTDMDIAI